MKAYVVGARLVDKMNAKDSSMVCIVVIVIVVIFVVVQKGRRSG